MMCCKLSLLFTPMFFTLASVLFGIFSIICTLPTFMHGAFWVTLMLLWGQMKTPPLKELLTMSFERPLNLVNSKALIPGTILTLGQEDMGAH